MLNLRRNGGFATATSAVLALAIATASIYMIKLQEKYQDVKVANNLATKTANRVNKVELATLAYLRSHGSNTPVSCQSLVQSHLISQEDCHDALGNPIQIQIQSSGNSTKVNFQVDLQTPQSENENHVGVYYVNILKNRLNKLNRIFEENAQAMASF